MKRQFNLHNMQFFPYVCPNLIIMSLNEMKINSMQDKITITFKDCINSGLFRALFYN